MSTKLSIPTRLAVLAVVAAGAWLAIPSASEAVGATTYYVSPTGSDSNNGTSPARRSRRLGRASNLPLAPGDQVLLQRGASFSGKLAIWRSGTAGSPITIGAYGTGSKPVVTGDCLEIGGSYITMTDFTVQYCTVNGIWTDGVGNVISNIEATHNIQGIDVAEHAKGTKVVRNYLHNNDRMAPNTPGEFDDWGAVGIVVQGDDTEVAYNTDQRQLGAVPRLRHRRLGGRDLRRHRHAGAPQHGQQQPDLHRAGQQPLCRQHLRLQPRDVEPEGHRVPDHPRFVGLLRPGQRHGRR